MFHQQQVQNYRQEVEYLRAQLQSVGSSPVGGSGVDPMFGVSGQVLSGDVQQQQMQQFYSQQVPSRTEQLQQTVQQDYFAAQQLYQQQQLSQQQQSQQQQQQFVYPGPPQPRGVAESGVGGTGVGVGPGLGPSLQPDNVKMDRPSKFTGKHDELENFVFQMRMYLDSVGLTGQNACKYVVSFLKGDALTWWRQYCLTHGGLSQVYTNLTVDDIFDELTTQFTDVEKQLYIRK